MDRHKEELFHVVYPVKVFCLFFLFLKIMDKTSLRLKERDHLACQQPWVWRGFSEHGTFNLQICEGTIIANDVQSFYSNICRHLHYVFFKDGG